MVTVEADILIKCFTQFFFLISLLSCNPWVQPFFLFCNVLHSAPCSQHLIESVGSVHTCAIIDY